MLALVCGLRCMHTCTHGMYIHAMRPMWMWMCTSSTSRTVRAHASSRQRLRLCKVQHACLIRMPTASPLLAPCVGVSVSAPRCALGATTPAGGAVVAGPPRFIRRRWSLRSAGAGTVISGTLAWSDTAAAPAVRGSGPGPSACGALIPLVRKTRRAAVQLNAFAKQAACLKL